MISCEELRAKVFYDPETGIMSWLRPPRRGVAAGPCGSVGKNGYVALGVSSYRTEYVHRLAWLYMTGKEPSGQIDHANGLRADNRWSNLRDVSLAQNVRNLRVATAKSKTGMLGAYPKRGKFVAQITTNGITKTLGSFKTASEAHEAYVVAKRLLHDSCTI